MCIVQCDTVLPSSGLAGMETKLIISQENVILKRLVKLQFIVWSTPVLFFVVVVMSVSSTPMLIFVRNMLVSFWLLLGLLKRELSFELSVVPY
jgi:hypothetical protein